MSKKDLLERLARAPSDAPPRPPRREEEAAPGRPPVVAPAGSADAVQRVSKSVVRRRRADEATTPAPVTTRRRAVDVDNGSFSTPAPPARTVARPVLRADERAPEPPIHEPEPEVFASPEPDQAAVLVEMPEPVTHAPVVVEEPPAVVEAPAMEAAPSEVAAAPIEVDPPQAEPARAEPAPREPREAPADRGARAPASRAARGPQRDGPAPVEADTLTPDAAPPSTRERPLYPGLGPAVVRPPPGYDPTNPQAFRRMQEAERSNTNAGQDRRTPAGNNRRRMETPAGGDRQTPPGGDYNRTPGPPYGRGGGGPGGPGEFTPPGATPDGPARRGRGRSAGPPPRVLERPMRNNKRRKPGSAKAASPGPKAAKRKIKVDNVISVGQLAHELGVKAPVVIRQLMDLGVMASITQMLDMDTAALVAGEFDYEVENVGFQEQNYLESVPDTAESENLLERPPVVTIMGHVDHGKTTLLDTIRKARVAAGEAGGITQHIGAYQVATDRGMITFIDTPGHAAFTAMRARGAKVTDIVVLVVAADDGVQPQTLEAIQHARAAKVPIVVAVNKMDKPGVTMDPIMTRMSEHELVPEQWGGETMYVPISALKNEGIDALLESILLQAEVLGLRANPDRFAEGVVLEAKMERGRGAVATVLVQRGTLKRGDFVVLGSAYGRVRAMVDSRGDQGLKEAGPSTPIELFGLSELPEVGDSVHSVKSEQNARALAEHRAKSKRDAVMASMKGPATAEDLFASANASEREEFRIILKADVGGSLQALKAAVEQIQVDGAEARILMSGVGDVTESDVTAASAYGAHILGFNVKLDAKARQAASGIGVEAEFYTVIYELLDRVTRGLKGLLAPVYEKVRVGTVEVRQLFKISKVGTVAGSYVIDGKIARSNFAKVFREGKLIWEGRVHSLRRFKDDVREVSAGYECGVSLDDYEDLQAGDLIEAYAEQLVENT